MKKFAPDSVNIPSGIETTGFKYRIMTVNDVVNDYDAVMSSINHLKGVFGSSSSWPSSDLTLEPIPLMEINTPFFLNSTKFSLDNCAKPVY